MLLISQQVLIITGVARLRCLTLMKLDRICVEHNQSNERLDITKMQLSPPCELYSLYKYTGNVCMNGHCRKKHNIRTGTYVSPAAHTPD